MTPTRGRQGVCISRRKSLPSRGAGQGFAARSRSERDPFVGLRCRRVPAVNRCPTPTPMFRGKMTILSALLLAVPPRVPAEGGSGALPQAGLSPEQRDFMKWRFGMFIHFNLATFAGTDWAGGYEDPGLFNPTKLDCGQWADAAKAAGMTYLVLTVKHTEGIALYPSSVTTRDTRMFRNFRNGNGDVVRDFVDACRSRGPQGRPVLLFSRRLLRRCAPECPSTRHAQPPRSAARGRGRLRGLHEAPARRNAGPIRPHRPPVDRPICQSVHGLPVAGDQIVSQVPPAGLHRPREQCP